jgi:hypothetical protein
MTNLNQRDATRNQSTVDYSQVKLFLFNNRYQTGLFKNNTGAELILKPGTLLLRDKATPTQVIPAIAGATLSDVIGIVKADGEIILATAGTLDINFGISGDIDENELVLPATVTLDTVPLTSGTRTVRDILQALGFVLSGSVQNTKYDN